MSIRSKLGWTFAAAFAVALVSRGDNMPPTAPLLSQEPSRPVTQWLAKPATLTASVKDRGQSTPRPKMEVAEAKPEQPAAIERLDYLTIAKVRMRSEPTTMSSAMPTVEEGAKQVVLGSRGGWHRVSVDGAEGWISSDYLTDRMTDVVAASNPPPPRLQQTKAHSRASARSQDRRGSALAGDMKLRLPLRSDAQRPALRWQ